mgnify:CR=1 FL=1
MKCLNFGSLNIDMVYSVDHCVNEGETEAVSKLEYFPGGKGLNQSIALAKAGAEVYHAGSVGKDGGILINELKNNGVDTSFINTTDCPNGHAVIQVDKNGQNSILVFGGANHRITSEQIDRVLCEFSDSDILFLQNEINAVDEIIDKAYKRNIKTVFNPSPFTEKIMNYPLDKISWFVVNETEAFRLTGETQTDRIFDVFKKQYPNSDTLLTLGENGAYCLYKGQKYFHPIYNTSVVDTTAAGDTFLGFFFANIDSHGISDSLKTASAAAAIAVSRNGASVSIPTSDEVDEFIRNK